jgi:glycine/D-amino acid oxidase-like deaminating enzyme
MPRLTSGRAPISSAALSTNAAQPQREFHLGTVRGWAGLNPVNAGERPQVGPRTDDGSVVVARGVGGSGIQVSPMIGRLAADWILYSECRTVPAAAEFVPTRFAA